jgi:hypothetical protein
MEINKETLNGNYSTNIARYYSKEYTSVINNEPEIGK